MDINKYRFLHIKKYVLADLRNFKNENQCLDTIAFALNFGGVAVELETEGLNFNRNENFIRKVRELTSAFDALFLVSSRTDVALAFEADGVVVCKDDISPDRIRKIAGKDFIIGQKISTQNELYKEANFVICKNPFAGCDIPVFYKKDSSEFFSELSEKIAVELTPKLLQH